MRKQLFVGLIGSSIIPALATGELAAQPSPAKVRPTFTISKETTWITEPLTADGFPDYIGALHQRLSQGVTPENNAAVLFYRAFGPAPDRNEQPDRFFELLGIPKPPPEGDYFVDYADYLRDVAGLTPADPEFQPAVDQQAVATMRPWTAVEFPHAAEWLNSNERPLALVIEGTRRPKYYSPLVVASADGAPPGLLSVPLPGVQESRGVARALCARAMLRIAEGRYDDAWQDLAACHRLGRLVGSGPTTIEGLVGIAIDAMAVVGDLTWIERTHPGAETVRRCLADLERLPPLPQMVDRIDLGERLMYLDSVMLLVRGDKDTLQLIEQDGFLGKLGARLSLNAIDWDVVLRMGNGAYDRVVAALRRADRDERSRAVNAVFDELEQRDDARPQVPNPPGGPKNAREAVSQMIGRKTLGLLLPAFGQIVLAEELADQRVRNLRIALALAAYRSDHGRSPRTLAELAPQYLKELPGDIFAGRPPVYRTTAQGYLLYSVGPNGQDDGGRERGDDPAGDDLVVRMPSRKDTQE